MAEHAPYRDDARRTPGEQYERRGRLRAAWRNHTKSHRVCTTAPSTPPPAPRQVPAADVGACGCQRLATNLLVLWALEDKIWANIAIGIQFRRTIASAAFTVTRHCRHRIVFAHSTRNCLPYNVSAANLPFPGCHVIKLSLCLDLVHSHRHVLWRHSRPSLRGSRGRCGRVRVRRKNIGVDGHRSLRLLTHAPDRKFLDLCSSGLQCWHFCFVPLVEVGMVQHSRLVRVCAQCHQITDILWCVHHLEKEELVPSCPVQGWHVRCVCCHWRRHISDYFCVFRVRMLVKVPIWCQVGLAGHHNVGDSLETPQLCKSAIGPVRKKT